MPFFVMSLNPKPGIKIAEKRSKIRAKAEKGYEIAWRKFLTANPVCVPNYFIT